MRRRRRIRLAPAPGLLGVILDGAPAFIAVVEPPVRAGGSP